MKQPLIILLLVANVLMAGIYLMFAADNWWIEPQLADVPGAQGGAPGVWFLTSVVAVVLAALVNAALLAFNARSIVEERRRQTVLTGLAVVAIWLTASFVDFLNH